MYVQYDKVGVRLSTGSYDWDDSGGAEECGRIRKRWASDHPWLPVS